MIMGIDKIRRIDKLAVAQWRLRQFLSSTQLEHPSSNTHSLGALAARLGEILKIVPEDDKESYKFLELAIKRLEDFASGASQALAREVYESLQAAVDELNERRERLDKREMEMEVAEQAVRLERLQLEELRRRTEQHNQNAQDMVDLNVGGTIFTTTRATLTAVPFSMLAAWFSGRHTMVRDTQGRVFVDRDPKMFEIVLAFLRNGAKVEFLEPYLKNDEISRRLHEEFDYFCLPWPHVPATEPDQTLHEKVDQNGIDVIEMKGHPDWVACVHVDGDLAVTGAPDGQVRVWDLNTCVLKHVLAGPNVVVKDVGIQGGAVVAAYGDGNIRVWDITNENSNSVESAVVFTVGSGSPCCMKINDGFLAVATLDDSGININTPMGQPGACFVWDVASGELVCEDNEANAMWSLGMRDGLVAWGHDRQIVVLDCKTRSFTQRWAAHVQAPVMFIGEVEAGWVSTVRLGGFMEIVMWDEYGEVLKARVVSQIILMEVCMDGSLFLRREDDPTEVLFEDFDGTKALYLRNLAADSFYDVSVTKDVVVSAHKGTLVCAWRPKRVDSE